MNYLYDANMIMPEAHTNSETLVVRSIKDACREFDSEDNLIIFLSELVERKMRLVILEDNISVNTFSAEFILSFIKVYRSNMFMIRSSNVRRGIRSAKTAGKKLGRPQKIDIEKIKSLRAKGFTIRKIAKLLSLSLGSVHKSLEKYHPSS